MIICRFIFYFLNVALFDCSKLPMKKVGLWPHIVKPSYESGHDVKIGKFPSPLTRKAVAADTRKVREARVQIPQHDELLGAHIRRSKQRNSSPKRASA